MTADLEAKQSVNVGVSEGKGYSNNSHSFNGGVGIKGTDKYMGITNEATHSDICPNPYHNNPAATFWQIKECNYTTRDAYVTTDHTEIHRDSFFVGISFDAYVGFGISFKIGFNIP